MAHVDKNSLLAGIHGPIGDMTIAHFKNGDVIARKRPTVKPKATPKRKAHRGKFGRASKYANTVLTVPEVRAIYQEAAQGTKLSAQNVAIADFMHGPVIEDIDLTGYTGRIGESIRVRAKDDYSPAQIPVESVPVLIRSLSGAVLEKGDAVMNGAAWVYVTQTEVPPAQIVKVEVTAVDRPGNRTKKTVPHLTRTEP